MSSLDIAEPGWAGRRRQDGGRPWPDWADDATDLAEPRQPRRRPAQAYLTCPGRDADFLAEILAGESDSPCSRLADGWPMAGPWRPTHWPGPLGPGHGEPRRAQASPAGWPRLPGRADIAHWRRRGVTAHTRYAHLSVSVFFKRPARIARLRGSAALTARRHLSNALSACLFGRRTALTLTPRRSTFCSALSRPTSLRASGLQS